MTAALGAGQGRAGVKGEGGDRKGKGRRGCQEQGEVGSEGVAVH